MQFTERTSAPAKTNKNYYSDKNPFYSKYVNNCTWYCWGRQLELGVKEASLKKNLPTSNAENWYHYTGFEKSSKPHVGDIIAYSAGKRHHAADGEGHVAIVERVYTNGNIFISESGSNMKFKTRTLKPPYKFYLNVKHKSNYKLDGFIHIQDYEEKWLEGNYITNKEKYVRKTPEVTSKNKVKYKVLSDKTFYVKDKLGYAKFKKSVELYLSEFKKDKKGNIWGKYNIYWICVEDSSGDQVRKV